LGSYIPIVKVVGKTSNVNGRKGYRGLVRNAIDSLRAYNYWFSTITEKLALSPKTPLIGAVGQFETHRDKWANANKVNYAFLEYDPIDVNGMAIPPPQRQSPAPLESAMINQLQVIEHDIQTALGMFKESVGQSSPQQSGKALMALQSQSDTGVFHFQDNLAMSVRHCGRIIVDLAPKIYDAPRIMRMLGEDGENSTAQIDPSQPQARTQVRDLYGNVQTIYNLGVGRYDVTTASGPSYATKRMEQADMMLQITQSQPEMMQTIGDLLFKSMDWPMADKISERLKKMLPPQLIEQEEEGQAPIPPQVQQAMAQIEQQTNELEQKAQALSQAEEEINKKSLAVEKGTVELMAHESELKNEASKLELDKYAFELTQREKELESGATQADLQTKIKIAEIAQETSILVAMHDSEHHKEIEKSKQRHTEKQARIAAREEIYGDNEGEDGVPEDTKEIEAIREIASTVDSKLEVTDLRLEAVQEHLRLIEQKAFEPKQEDTRLTDAIARLTDKINEPAPEKDSRQDMALAETMAGIQKVLTRMAKPKTVIRDEDGKITGVS
jgi:hypothetical protein